MATPNQSMKPTAPLRYNFSVVATEPLDFIQVPGFPSAIRVFALTLSRRNVVQRYPWLISFSLGRISAHGGCRPSRKPHKLTNVIEPPLSSS
jgi:hypothetical protein